MWNYEESTSMGEKTWKVVHQLSNCSLLIKVARDTTLFITRLK